MLEAFPWIQYITVVCAMIFADVCWTMYFIETQKRNAFLAGVWSGAIYLGSAVAITNFVGNPILISAAVVGAFIGTYITIKWKNRKES